MLKRIFPFVTIGALSAIGIMALSPAAQAQNSSTFESAVIRPKFAPDPMQLKGVTGGKSTAKAVAGTAETETGACLGFMDKQPYHRLELKQRFRYLSIMATSSTDTTMIIKGPGGVWCNDDYDEKNAGISGEWLPGGYDVWVGSYSKTKAVPYVLKISETR
ncbi:hypothetical protein IQ266_13195 [filamentous cyanobacterium LEGE 11480]|uniref:Uncharacterized protein n=1 Tax=Romeriopsis navalis LEGE 11480 TaxID=2777977 RepID=A0A928VN58_9CYAN|nr:hypothetical protein [Romeriopsis navalis]MBE9030687.1 hypothetical protein [Romeriopsis navalis LEGE 11480]